MDHVVIPLDDDHDRALALLRRHAGAARGGPGHVTVASYDGVDHAIAEAAVRLAIARVEPFFVRAHGFGFFVTEPGDASVHVPVVRDPVLDALHASIASGLRGRGAKLADWTAPDLWSPHITVFEGGLDPDALAVAVAALARRHHPSWRIPVGCVELVGSRDGPAERLASLVPLTG